jgi:putative FmdB family regulatory protein
MPVYEFYCPKCDKKFEEITIRAYWKDIRCRTCGGEVVKTPTTFGINVKGFNAKNGYSKTKE